MKIKNIMNESTQKYLKDKIENQIFEFENNLNRFKKAYEQNSNKYENDPEFYKSLINDFSIMNVQIKSSLKHIEWFINNE
jgi:hypothetical protein